MIMIIIVIVAVTGFIYRCLANLFVMNMSEDRQQDTATTAASVLVK